MLLRFRARVTKVAAGGTDELIFEPDSARDVTFVDRWSVEDATSAVTTNVRSVVRGHGYDHPLREQKTPSAASLYWDDQGTFLNRGEQLVAVFTGTTAADRLSLYIEGWYDAPDNEEL